jgi:hypothetical protein
MSWVDPRTWTGISVTSAMMNEIRDSLRASGGARTTTTPALVDESEWNYPADTANGVVWRFKYNSGSASAFKWEFVGGAAMVVEVQTSETTTSASYVDLATVGPSVTVPRAGDYEVEFGASMSDTTGGVAVYTAVKRGAAATSDNDIVTVISTGAIVAPGFSVSRKMPVLGLAASDVLKLQHKVGGGTGTFIRRWIAVRPIRVS